MLKLGSTGEAVRQWQLELLRCHYELNGGADGRFGRSTHNATLAWQLTHGLAANGTVGDAEIAKLELPVVVQVPFPVLPALEHIPYVECAYWQRGVTRDAIDLIVIHDMENAEASTSALRTAQWLAGNNPNYPPPRASAHYFFDCAHVVQGVRDDCVAWHAPGVNHNALGFEHAGLARQTQAQWLDDFGARMLALSAQLAARKCKQYGLPVVFCSPAVLLAGGARGITTHAAVNAAFKRSDHTDPGEGFPMQWYLQQVQAELDKLAPAATS